MGIVRTTIAALALAGGATALQAADDSTLRTADHNGAREIVRGDYAKAERVLAAARQVSPNDAELMLNQAQLYLRSGRVEQARALYRQVMALPDEQMLLTGDRWAGSHTLARTGLQAASANQLVAR